ncbi:MAG TPA: DNA starvation/stationary phase protection protein [Rhodospirillaceae bacterium]|nr:DNA starvation/stationary phase protection protein [Rhodospirillaceae bacterium]
MAKKTVTKSKAVKVTSSAKVSNAQASMAKQLANVLSDTYVLAVKTHGYHWNVVGMSFAPLHAFFGEQYASLTAAADEIAERIRALGMMPDGSMESFLQNTVITEAGTKALTAEGMLADLLASHELVRERLVEAENMADDIDDLATQDLMVKQLGEHEKTMWMIRSHITK